MNISKEIQKFLLNDVIERFLRYVKVWTTSDETSISVPSTKNQFELGKILVDELKEIGLNNVIQDEFGYVYANLPPSKGYENSKEIGLIAHLDTSPAVIGKNVKPVIHKNYDGEPILFAKDNKLSLTLLDSPNLEGYKGLDIITSQGDTLLGADDKAGIAEIMAACAAWHKFDELKHGSIYICFSPDEEIGLGIQKVNIKKLPEICYTVDGGEIGELEYECFDAWSALIKFKGLNVHPGYAKNKMINAIQIASRYFSELPEAEAPENTEEREGYYHLTKMEGNTEEATARMLIRDFEIENNQRRINYLKSLKQSYELRYPGLKIDLDFKHQYLNMLNYIEKNTKVIELAKRSIEKAGLEVKIHSIRGGTDGAQLSARGIITPNIFTGGELFHSRKEFIPTIALQKAAEVLIYVAQFWAESK
ncbi:MAG: peptidase T [Candidatus Odinarchaeota archaeon]